MLNNGNVIQILLKFLREFKKKMQAQNKFK